MSSNPTKQNPTPTADASIAAASTSSPAGADKKDEVPKLGALEEDDEFEEFAEQGTFSTLLVTSRGRSSGLEGWRGDVGDEQASARLASGPVLVISGEPMSHNRAG